jgi:hypothetical protein
MADEETTTQPAQREEKRELPAGVIAGVVFMAAVLAGVYFVIEQQSDPSPQPAPTQEAEAYLPNLGMADLRLSAEENFLGQQATYVDGRLSNQGDRTILRLKLRLYFQDVLNQVILQQDRDIIQAALPLPPGESREFRLHFAHIPDSWNRQVPQFQLVGMEFQQPSD